MRISTLFYLFKQGLKNIKRNKMFSLASVATMAACIFLFGCFFSVVVNFKYMVHKAEEGVAVTVFFDEDVTEARITQIGKLLSDIKDNLCVSGRSVGKLSERIFWR